MDSRIKKAIDRELEFLAGAVYSMPDKEDQEEAYYYIGEQAQKTFKEYAEISPIECIFRLLKIADDLEVEKKEKDKNDSWKDLFGL